ncbi:MAG: MmgE/PrpD family protein, partial [Beijerinckiaceae bacterium]
MNAPTPVTTAVTETLADFVVRSTAKSIPDAVYAEAARSFLNWAGCAVGGATHAAIDSAWAAAKPFAGAAQASVLGRDIRTDVL